MTELNRNTTESFHRTTNTIVPNTKAPLHKYYFSSLFSLEIERKKNDRIIDFGYKSYLLRHIPLQKRPLAEEKFIGTLS